MEQILHTLQANSGTILLVFCVLFGAMALLVVRQGVEIRRIRSRWRTLLEGTGGENLERLLVEQLRERAVIDQQIAQTDERLETLEKKMRTSKRYMGIVRYDAFGDMAGSQSFALAVYDERGNGAVLSSVVGRSDCRVYCKPLSNGKCEYSLSEEEQKAIAEAAGERGKSLIHS